MEDLRSPSWKSEAYKNAIRIVEMDARSHGISGDKVIPLDAQMEWGGTMAVGVLVGDDAFIKKWTAASPGKLAATPTGEWIKGKGRVKLRSDSK